MSFVNSFKMKWYHQLSELGSTPPSLDFSCVKEFWISVFQNAKKKQQEISLPTFIHWGKISTWVKTLFVLFCFVVLLCRNPALEDQACDRIYRMGQTRSVHIHKFVCSDTIEERILQLQKKKTQLANDVLTGYV